MGITATLDGSTTASVDFNPGANRLRVVTLAGQNLRIDVVDITATAITAAVAAGTTVTDGAINRTDASASTVLAAACSYRTFASFTAASELFGPGGITNVLAQQNPPNNDTLLTAGSLGLHITGLVGFDTAGRENARVSVRCGLESTRCHEAGLFKPKAGWSERARGSSGFFVTGTASAQLKQRDLRRVLRAR